MLFVGFGFGCRYIKLDIVKTKKQSVLLPVESMCSASQSVCYHFFSYDDLRSKVFR